MGCKSAIYCTNVSSQALVPTNNVNFGVITRRFGDNLNLLGGNVVIKGAGYYEISASFGITGSSAGDVAIQLYLDGVPISGATASITTATGDNYTVTIPSMIREFCCKESIITAVLSGVDATVNVASIVVEKI